MWDQEVHQRGDSDDEIAELRFQALLTKRENEAEVSPAREPRPFSDNAPQISINQPLSNFQGQPPFNFRGRGRGLYHKPYLHTFSQQIASKCVNSSNIVVLTSSEPDPDESRQAFPPDWMSGRRGFVGRGGRWPRRGGRGMHPHAEPLIRSEQQAPPLILPQDKYAMQSQAPKENPDQNKAKLSARMRRLQGSDTDSEDSESDSSDDSSSSDSSSDSNSSSSDSSSSDSDSESETNQVSKKNDKPIKKEKVKLKGDSKPYQSQVSLSKTESLPEPSEKTSNNSVSKPKSPVKPKSSEPQLPTEVKKSFTSPSFRKESSRSPSYREKHSPPHRFRSRSPSFKAKKGSHSPSSTYSQRLKPSPRKRKSKSFSPRRYSRSPRRSRTPLRRYDSRSPYQNRKSKSPLRRAPYGRFSKSPPPFMPKKFSKSPPGRFRSRSKSPYLNKRFRSRSRSPYLRKSRSPLPRKLSRSPLPLRRSSRSPLPPRLKSKSPFASKRYLSRSPKHPKRYSSITPPPVNKAYTSRSPYGGRRYGTPSPRPYLRRSSSFSPKRYRGVSPRNSRPLYKEYRSKSPRPLGQGSPHRRRSFSPLVKRYGSRSPINRGRESPRGKRSPFRSRSPIGFSSPRKIKRIGSLSPQPLLPLGDKFSGHVAPRSPYRKYSSRSPLNKRYEPPPRRGASPPRRGPSLPRRGPSPPRRGPSPLQKLPRHLAEAPIFPNDRGEVRPLFPRNLSPRGHNYTNRSPSPYFRGRCSPGEGIPISERGPPRSKSPMYYGARPDHPFSGRGRGNRNDPYEQNLPLVPKRYPLLNPNNTGQHPQWPPHKPEQGLLPHKPPLLSHYPPKFSGTETSYGGRSDFMPPPLQQPPPQQQLLLQQHHQQQHHQQQLPEKVWPPNVPNRTFGENYGGPHPNERIHQRSERFPPNGPQQNFGGRGRGPRGPRGHSGRGGGIHARLGGRGSWSGPPQGGPPNTHEPPPYGDSYIREKQGRLGPPIHLMPELETGYMDRKQPPYESIIPLLPPLMHKANSPGLQRIPRGPKTPPYSPNREPSPLEWQKRGQISLKDRTPSLSPSPSRRYGNEPLHPRQHNQNRPPRERDIGQERRTDPYDVPSGQRQGRYNPNKFPYDSHKPNPRSENVREPEERRKVLKTEEDHNKEKDLRKHHSLSSGKGSDSDPRPPRRDKEKMEREPRRRSPPPSAKLKPSTIDSRSQSDFKEETRNKSKREREVEIESRSRREKEMEEAKSRREREDKDQKRVRDRSNEEDQKGRRPREQKPRRERDTEVDQTESVRENTKPRIEAYDNSLERNKVKERSPIKSDKKQDRNEVNSRRHAKDLHKSAEQTVVEERKSSKETEEVKKKKELESNPKKEELSDEGDKKKKRKKKHKEEDKVSKSTKKKKKEKKKRKDSKKKSKKGSRDSEVDDPLPKKKRKILKDEASNGSREGDLRQMLTKRDESPREGSVRRRKDASFAEEKLDDRKKRREDGGDSGKDWKLGAREKPRERDRSHESRRRDERPPNRDRDRRLPERRDHLDHETRGGSKGLTVTVGSGAANRQVTSGNSSSAAKGSSSKKETPRVPVHMRLGPGSGADNNASDDASSSKTGNKKMRRLTDGRRRVYGEPNAVSGLRRPGVKGQKGSSR